jgi:hypothetical protein
MIWPQFEALFFFFYVALKVFSLIHAPSRMRLINGTDPLKVNCSSIVVLSTFTVRLVAPVHTDGALYDPYICRGPHWERPQKCRNRHIRQ